MAATAGTVHFWTRNRDALVPWDPDDEPELHSNAYGHAFLELYARMHALGYSVSIGPTVPAASEVIVASLHELFHWEHGTDTRETLDVALRALVRRRPAKVVIIRVDVPLGVQAPAIASLTMMPTRASVESTAQVWVPMLPNRGLIARRASRGTDLAVVALKAYSFNVPAWVDEYFMARLAALDFELRVDTEVNGRWRDFASVDVVLCAHDDSTLEDERRKPATKLINAWRAGVIPVCGPYSAYAELGRDGETMLVCDGSAEGFIEALTALRSRPAVTSRIRSNLAEQTNLYAPDRIVELWWKAFLEAAPATRRQLAVGAGGVFGRLLKRKLRIRFVRQR